MSEFPVRAESLVDRITSEPSDPGVEQEVQALERCGGPCRRPSAPTRPSAAQAIARARAAAPVIASAEDDAAAQRALKGLDRIDVEAPPQRRYAGRGTPTPCSRHSGWTSSGPASARSSPRRWTAATAWW